MKLGYGSREGIPSCITKKKFWSVVISISIIVIFSISQMVSWRSFLRALIYEEGESKIVPGVDNIEPKEVVLVTGAAGFIGMHLSLRLLKEGKKVIGLDNLNDKFYSSLLKEHRLDQIVGQYTDFTFVRGDVCDRDLVASLMLFNGVSYIVHLASQEYTRDDSMVTRPFHYPLNNLDCFVDILEVLKSKTINGTRARLLYASSSTSYRSTYTIEKSNSSIDEVVLPDGNTNFLRSNELIARAYHSLYKISSTGIRLPTVYGPWGRPDMSYFRYFSQENTHDNFDKGSSQNLMFIDDAVDAIIQSMKMKESGAEIHVVGSSYVDKSEKFTLNLTLGSSLFRGWYNKQNGQQYLDGLSLYRVIDDMPSVRSTPLFSGDLCFVTSMFSPSSNKTDKLRDISSYNHSAPFSFLFFTNLDDLEINGWERILMTDLPFKRMITESRWPKFMGWQHPRLQSCKVVVYSDANIPPKDVALERWETEITHHALEASSGIYQRPNTRVNSKRHMTVIEELEACVKDKKDLAKNVMAQIQWLKQQPDFNNTAFGYWNMILVYDPTNPKFQELMTTFWAHYSAEDQSWRDQPLYRYLVDKLKIIPETRKSFSSFFHPKSGKNKKQHKYSSLDDHNALHPHL